MAPHATKDGADDQKLEKGFATLATLRYERIYDDYLVLCVI